MKSKSQNEAEIPCFLRSRKASFSHVSPKTIAWFFTRMSSLLPFDSKERNKSKHIAYEDRIKTCIAESFTIDSEKFVTKIS